MDLKTFIKETLVQIVEGVEDARLAISSNGSNASVNPHTSHSISPDLPQPKPVEFDVAVTVIEQSEDREGSKMGGSAGLLSVVSFKAAAEMQEQQIGSRRNEMVNRIRFSVMLTQPSNVDHKPIHISSAEAHNPYV